MRTVNRGTARLGLALFFGVALLGGCGPVRSYSTRAVYDAPRNGYRIDVSTSGSLPNGLDHNPTPAGTVRITPLAGAANPVVTLDLAGDGKVKYAVGDQEPVEAPWEEGGDANKAQTEFEEAVLAIGGVLRGPKLTLMGGQTKHLVVVSVAIR
jgi:hypothetical protein